jgi:tight adherence protein B
MVVLMVAQHNGLGLLAAADWMLMMTLLVGPLLALYGILQLVSDLRNSSKKRISSRLRGKAGAAAGPAKLSAEDLRRQTKQAAGLLGAVFSRMSATQRLQTLLEQANLTWTASSMLGNMTVAAVVLAAVTVFLGLPLLAAIGLAAAVFVLPVYWLIWRRKRRLKKFVHQLPGVFDLLGQALRAGHSLASGMQLVASELPDPAGTEFGRVFQEQNLGLKIEDALANMANRMDTLDVRFFVTAVLIQRQTGGDLGEVLDKISGVIRDRIKLHGTVMALTAEGRLSGYVLLALPVVVYVALLYINREYANVLLHHPTGQMMLTTAVIMMIMGYFLIKKIVNIKV